VNRMEQTDDLVMCEQQPFFLSPCSLGSIPDEDFAVLAAGEDHGGLVRVPHHRVDRPLVPLQLAQLLRRLHVPEKHLHGTRQRSGQQSTLSYL
jgi:hypothetical protein